ncbi:MAG TPA: hypothetical protein DHN33_07140, partial [Eubacteriaceae bacterium]|nr:hypothetical protein [Eubacteriaceae bacterium]
MGGIFIQYFKNLFIDTFAQPLWVSTLAAYLAAFCILLIVSYLSFLIAKKIVRIFVDRWLKKTKHKWAQYLVKCKVFEQIAKVIPLLIILAAAPYLAEAQPIVERVAGIVLLIFIAKGIDALVEAADDIYKTYEVSKEKPIQGFLQVIKIASYVMIGILIVAI